MDRETGVVLEGREEKEEGTEGKKARREGPVWVMREEGKEEEYFRASSIVQPKVL